MLDKSLTAPLVFYRTYSRRTDNNQRESWLSMVDRVMKGLQEIGNLSDRELELIRNCHVNLTALSSGRWMWIGGTDWVSKKANFQGAYNCSNVVIDSFERMAFCMDLLMQGCGVGTIIETDIIDALPPIATQINLTISGRPGIQNELELASSEQTEVGLSDDLKAFVITVGDSRKGWSDAYQEVLKCASGTTPNSPTLDVIVDLCHVRASGTPIKGFGGVSNPSGLNHMFERMAKILNGAVGRKLNSVEVCLLLDEPAKAVVAGNVRRSANIRQFSSDDVLSQTAKDNLWINDNGSWKIDPERDALRMSNHTRVFHGKPSLDECILAVKKQYQSGEGAIGWAGEAIARGNADLLDTNKKRLNFLGEYDIDRQAGKNYLEFLLDNQNVDTVDISKELKHRMNRYGTNPCLAAGTTVVTRNGHYPIEQLVGKTVEIWDGLRWTEVNNFRVTGENIEVYKVVLSNGQEIFATKNHKFPVSYFKSIECHQLQSGTKLVTHGIGEFAKPVFKPLGSSKIEVVSVALDRVEPKVYCCTVPTTHMFALTCGVLSGNCGEIVMVDNFCNLADVHLNLIDPLDPAAQEEAFEAAALVASALLHHQFEDTRMNYSRVIDPIVGVSITGLFDFFVNKFGIDWLRWWEAGRPDEWNPVEDVDYVPLSCVDAADYFRNEEAELLAYWKQIVESTVWEYCDRNNIKRPNRCTTVQPSGSKSLLTGASPGWHPPKAQRFIRRITFRKNDPVALAAIDYGYSVIPSQSDKDENGSLLDDPFDTRCTEWLVEVPIEVGWANLEGADKIDIPKFSALAQFDFYMQVQKHYTTHNTSATIEFREQEIEVLGARIYEAILNDEGYISAALLARFDSLETFPRMPFEPIDKATYDRLIANVSTRRKSNSFDDAMAYHDGGHDVLTGPIACDSDKCLMPELNGKK